MTPSSRLSAALASIHWGPRALANASGIAERSIYRWLAGQNEPPADVVTWLEGFGRYLRDNPAPDHRNCPTAPPGGAAA